MTDPELLDDEDELLAAEEDWLTDNRESIASQIHEGWDEAKSGVLSDSENVRREMQRFKTNWKKQ